jgi:alpha-glucuronidase
MSRTQLMMEFQLTQEYLGQGTHLVFEAPLFKECLESDTYAAGKGSTVASIIDGSLDKHPLSGMAGVANIGSDINWTGHPFAQANWFAFGRLAWDHRLSSVAIAGEWLRLTFTNNPEFIAAVKTMMLGSRETLNNYMTPMGLHHIMGYGHHYGPAPWYNRAPRADWNPVYFHRADSMGIGFNRTASGSNALAQYAAPVREHWENAGTCPEQLLLWFHHIPWNYRLASGRTLWEELCYKYYTGAKEVSAMQATWEKMRPYIDEERFTAVRMLLSIQQKEAAWWRDACVLYFQTCSKMPLPTGYEQPLQSLTYYESLRFPYAPGKGN